MRRSLALVALFCIALTGISPATTVNVDGNMALAGLVSLCDAHLSAVVDGLSIVAQTPEAATESWSAIRPTLAQVAKRNLAGQYAFVNSAGTYWTVEKGLQSVKLSDRPYFAAAMKGTTVIGALVVSRSTGKEAAVVAVPVRSANGKIGGVVLASIYLDTFSALLANEIGLRKGYVFFAIDRNEQIILHADPANIFAKPAEISPELKPILARLLGPVGEPQSYVYKGVARTMLLRDSPLTGWRFGFGTEHR